MVLRQLVGYDDDNEHMAVLMAGLTVREVEFAEKLLGLTEEALERLQIIPSSVDGDLVRIVGGFEDKGIFERQTV